MGLPATWLLANNGRSAPYRFYVWLADDADGPIWRLMDRGFDEWNHRTGEQVAFFVDPFQKPEWAQEFLGHLELDPRLVEEALRASRAARMFYRDRLSINLARHLRIGREFFPIAIVTPAWDADSAAVCFLRGERDVERLLARLIDLALSDPTPHPTLPQHRAPFRQDAQARSTRQLAHRLRSEFDVQVHEFPRPLVHAVRGALDETAAHHFIRQLCHSAEQSPWVLGSTEISEARGFGVSKAYVALESFDDLLAVAEEMAGPIGRIAERYPADVDAMMLREQMARLSDLVERFDELARKVRDALRIGDERAVVTALDPFEAYARQFNLAHHLIETLGARTYGGLTSESRDSVAASELIYLMSLRINDLRRDLTGALVGYWKATEREGRRVIAELLDQGLSVAYLHEGAVRPIERSAVQALTLGGLRAVFRELVLSPKERAPALATRDLADLLTPITFKDRNQRIHSTLLTSPTELEAARNRMGCKNPGGILPRLVSCLAAIDLNLAPDLPNDTAPPTDRELGSMAPQTLPNSEHRDQWLTSQPPHAPVAGHPPGEVTPDTRPGTRHRGLPVGSVGEWIVSDKRSKKGRPVLRQNDGIAQGILHPESEVPPDLEPGKSYRMRVVAGGSMAQLKWIVGES